MRRNPDLDNPRKLAPRCTTATRKIGARTIAHLVDEKSIVQPQLDTIVAIAQAFRVQPWMLLTPDFDPATKRGGEMPPPEILALAYRIMENRGALLDIFGKDTVPDDALEVTGWNASPQSPSVHQKGKDYKVTPHQTRIKFKR